MQNATPINRAGANAGLLTRLGAAGPTYGALAALILLVTLNIIFTPNFAEANNFVNLLLQVTPTVLVAIGMTLVIATGGIDLSVGSVMAIASAIAAVTLVGGVNLAIFLSWIVAAVVTALIFSLNPVKNGHWSVRLIAYVFLSALVLAIVYGTLIPGVLNLGGNLIVQGVVPAVILSLFLSLALGTMNGALITGFRIQPIIVTLALLITGRGVAQVMSQGGQLIPFDNPTFQTLGSGYVGPVPVQVLIMIAIAAAAYFLMRMTAFGRYVVATGGNEVAARLAGVKVQRTKIAVYAISGLLAGLAGLIETARLGASDAAKVGLNIELDAIAAVVIGGTPLTGGRATILGTLIGALIMQIITMSFNMHGIKFSWGLVVKAAIIIIAVYIQRPRAA